MGLWNSHGMDVDKEEVYYAAAVILGMTPEELMVMADNADKEAWVYRQCAKQEQGQKKRKCNLIAGHWQKRARRWKELAAEMEQEITDDEERQKAKKEISS